jgi:hypothetical protein
MIHISYLPPVPLARSIACCHILIIMSCYAIQLLCFEPSIGKDSIKLHLANYDQTKETLDYRNESVLCSRGLD